MTKDGRLPLATLLLIGANVLAAFAALFVEGFVANAGFYPARPTFLSVFGSLFVHQNLLHLLGNMVFLAAVGAAVEIATGSARFLTVYLLSGIAGVAAHFFTTGSASPDAVLVGASGCVAGCVGYYALRYLRLRVPLAPNVGTPIAAIIGIWLALQALGAFVHIGQDNAAVSYWSHLGGFLMGVLLSMVFRTPDLGQRELGHVVLDKMNERGPAAVARAAEDHLKHHPDDPKAMKELGDALEKLGERKQEAAIREQIIEKLPCDQWGDSLGRLLDLGTLRSWPVMKRLKLADAIRIDDPKSAALLLETVIAAGPSEPQRPETLLSLAGLYWETERGKALAALALLTKEYPMHPTTEVAKQRGWLG